jgi:hypothetical protein
MRACVRAAGTRNQAVLRGERDRRKRRSGNPADLRSAWMSREQAYSIVGVEQRLAPIGRYCLASGAAKT